MKKNVLFFVLIAGFVMSLTSCLFLIPKTFKMDVDKDISEDKRVLVTFTGGGNVMFILREWNGNKISDDLYGKKFIKGGDIAKLTVPAGNNSFSFELYFTFSSQNSSTTYSFKDIELRYDLESGNEYQIKGYTKSLGLFKGYEFYVGIYEKQGNNLLKEWKLG